MEKDKKKTPIYKRKKYWIIAVLLVVAFFVIRAITSGSEKPLEEATVSRGTVKEELVLTGEIRAVEDADLPFGGSGTIAWVGVKVGDRVTKGQALMKLDTVQLNSAYQRAASAYRLTQATVDKVHDSLKDKGNSESFTEKETRTTAEVANDQAYESYKSAQKALRDATLVSPFDGIVTAITNEVAGVNVTVGTPQIKVINPESLYFSVNADQTEVGKLSEGQKTTLFLDAFETEISGVISNISYAPSAADSGTVYPIRISFGKESTSKYLLGMTGDASFTLSEVPDTMFVPNKFVKSDKTGKYVLVDQGKTKKYIEVGIEGDDRVEIKGDIVEGVVVYN